MKVIALIVGLLVFTAEIALAKEFTVAALYWSKNIEGQVAMRAGLESELNVINEAAKKTNQPTIKLIPYLAGDGEEGIRNQQTQMLDAIKRKVDLIIIQPTSSTALGKGLLEANLNGIPVIAYDQYITAGRLLSYVTSNNYQAGYFNGEFVAAKFPNGKKLRIILVEYPLISGTIERVSGFIDALNEYNQSYKIVKHYTAVEPVEGRKVGKQIIKDFPKKESFDVVFTVNDGGGLSVVEELEKAGRNEVFVATVDGDPRAVQKIKKGSIIKIDSAQLCGELGRKSIDLAYKYLTGNQINNHVLVPVFPITKDSAKYYTGWLAPMPQSFKKTWKSNNPMWKGEFQYK